MGPDKQRYTPHKEILTRVKFFAACPDSGFRESKENEMSLPEEEPELFEKLLEYLYQDKIEAEKFSGALGTPDNVFRKIWVTTVMAAVWTAADKHCKEACQNHIVDYLLVYCQSRIPSPQLISEISKRGPRDGLLRKLMLRETVAY